MKKIRSQEFINAKNVNPSLNNNYGKQEFQTQSSVQHYYQKIRTKDDVYRSKIRALQKNLEQTLTSYSSLIQQQRLKLVRLAEKQIKARKIKAESLINMKKSMQQLENAVLFLLSKLKDYHESENLKISNFYQLSLKQLQSELSRQTEKFNQQLKQMLENKAIYVQSKDKFKVWVINNFKSDKTIKNISQAINKKSIQFKIALQQSKAKQEVAYSKAKQNVFQIFECMQVYLEQEITQRQTNKEEIVETFQTIFRQSDLNLF